MIAAIPFFELGVYNLVLLGYDIPIDPWATLVCIGFVVGMEIARYRGIQLGLSVRDIVDGSIVIVLSGFLMAHVFTVLFYFPERMLSPETGNFSFTEAFSAIFIRFYQGFSSTGGFVGALLGAFVFYKYVRKVDLWTHTDTICFGFPMGWFFGRMGCGVVHDHIGKETTFALAMDFDRGFGPWVGGDPFTQGIRHELGLYEMAYMIPVSLLFVYLGKYKRPPGFFLALFGVCYAPVRFLMDFLRNDDLGFQDARYVGLTPAQYGMIAMFLAACWVLWRLERSNYTRVPLTQPSTES